MRLPEVNIIKTVRKQIGISQTQLAREARVSQSIIARVESGKIDPSYTKMKKIFSALEKLGKGKILRARNILNKNVVSVSSNKSIRYAVKIMKKKGISQLPVIDNDVVVGSLSERDIIEKIATEENIDNISLIPVKDIMGDAFPMIDIDSSLGVISLMLEYYPALLITDSGKLKGIITKADLLKLM